MAADLVGLGYRPSPFTAPQDQGGADGVRFKYQIEDGSRDGDTVTLAVAVHDNEGEWPEVAPHWVYLSPPDDVSGGTGEGVAVAGSRRELQVRERSGLDGDQRPAERLLGPDRHARQQEHEDVPGQAHPQDLEHTLKRRVVVRELLHRQLADHLLSGFRRGGWQEEACLALWRPGDGLNRYTGILAEVVLPHGGDRDLHGNVTVQGEYLNRVLDRALKAQAGVAVLHSHPGPGWQALSSMDDDTERNIIAPFIRETGLPLLGLTIGSDGVWSARFWQESGPDRIAPVHCTDVRRVGPRYTGADWSPDGYPPYVRRPSLVRTVDSWGVQAQARLARTHVCVVGAGSVGSIVLESLARTGFEEITIIDPDLVEETNLDRLIYADRHCLGVRKAEVAADHFCRVATARGPVVRPVPLSIRTERAYRLAADADVIVCCVDNAEAREVLESRRLRELPSVD